VKGADGEPRPVEITTGVTNGSMTEVIGGGLKAGDVVITGQLTGNGAASGGQRRRSGAGGAAGGQRSGQ
jgi:HlyD family secretion protein